MPLTLRTLDRRVKTLEEQIAQLAAGQTEKKNQPGRREAVLDTSGSRKAVKDGKRESK